MVAITSIASSTALTWTNAAAWTGGVPGIVDDVTILATTSAISTITLTTNVTVSSMTVSGSASGTARAGTLQLVNSTSTITNSLTLTNGAAGPSAGGFLKTFTGNNASFLKVSGTVTGTGTVLIAVGTLTLNTASIASTGSMLASGASAVLNVDVGSLGSSATNSLKVVGVAAGATFNLVSGSLELTSGLTGLSSGTVKVSAGTLKIDTAVAISSTGTLLAAGGTVNVAAGGAAGGGGIVLADIAGGAVRIGATLTAGTIAFAASGTTTQTLFDDSTGGNALAGRSITGFHGTDQIVVNGATQYKIITGGGTTTGTIGALNGGGATLQVLSFAGGLTLGSNNDIISGQTLTASAACYLAGTRVSTLTGAVAVEDLMIGDLLLTADFGAQPVRWIGQRAYLARLVHAHHRAALMPIRINAGALGDNIPSADLFVSPEHMMVLDGVLVAAHSLLNGATITRFENLDVVKYFHIELDQHSVIFANGAPAESYLDTGNRNMFTNVVDYAELGMAVGSTVPCLPIVSDGPALAAIRAGIADRAEACGFTTSADADLHLLVDGAVVYPSAVAGSSYSFDISENAGEIQIVSRSVVPAEIEAVSADRRRLGVAVAKLTLRGNGMSVEVLAGEKLLADGFFPADGGHRWTNGAAQFPAALLALMDGAFSVTVELVGTGLRYPVASRGDVVALASARGPRVAGAQRLVA